MKCRACKTVFYIGGGTGYSDAPGVFLAGAVLGGLVALAGYGIRFFFPAFGFIVMLCGGIFAGASLLLINTAIADATMYGPRHCPTCRQVVPVHPWSL